MDYIDEMALQRIKVVQRSAFAKQSNCGGFGYVVRSNSFCCNYGAQSALFTMTIATMVSWNKNKYLFVFNCHQNTNTNCYSNEYIIMLFLLLQLDFLLPIQILLFFKKKRILFGNILIRNNNNQLKKYWYYHKKQITLMIGKVWLIKIGHTILVTCNQAVGDYNKSNHPIINTFEIFFF